MSLQLSRKTTGPTDREDIGASSTVACPQDGCQDHLCSPSPKLLELFGRLNKTLSRKHNMLGILSLKTLICLQLKKELDYITFMELAPSKNWPLVLDLSRLPMRIASFACDAIPFFSNVPLLASCPIWRSMVLRLPEHDLGKFASRNWDADELRAA